MRKKRVAIHTDHSTLFSGFAKFKRTLLKHLYKTGKYEIIEFSNGVQQSPELDKLPWKCVSTVPNQQETHQINSIQDQGQREVANRQASYGKFGLPRCLKENKIDVLVSAQDSWGVDFIPSISEAKNVTFIPHVTIDSEGLLSSQIDLAGAVDKLYVWASFAKREYAKYGYKNIEFLPGCVDSSNFYAFDKETKKELRKKFGLNDSFSTIYIFRNQLRKLVPNLMDGFKLFKDKFPESKAKLILITSAQEGWNLQELARQRNIPNEDVYLCYFCKHCKRYELRPFFGHDQDCPFCGAKNTFNTINIVHGVSEEQLNEIYNCADVFASVMTSGGMEICPSIEAKCAELPVICTNYSCGEDIVGDDRGGIAIDYEAYYECNSGFKKASSQGSQVLDALEKVWRMSPEERENFGKIGRKFVLENLSPEVIGKRFEEIIDAAPFADWDNFNPRKNDQHQPPPNLSPQDFVIDLFTNILKERVDKNNSQVKFWTEHLQKTNDHQGTYNHFVNQARAYNAQLDAKPVDFGNLLNSNDGKRLLICMPESAGDVVFVNSLVPNIRRQYPEFAIYFATKPQFKAFVEHLEGVTWLEYIPAMDDIFWLTGRGEHKGWFDIAFLCQNQTQRQYAYQWRTEELRPEWLNSVRIENKTETL